MAELVFTTMNVSKHFTFPLLPSAIDTSVVFISVPETKLVTEPSIGPPGSATAVMVQSHV